MFFGEGKIGPMRETILAGTVEERRAALARLLPLQRADFAGLFRAMNGRPVTIRTLDPPLHEFLPHDEAGQREVAAALGIPFERVRERVEALHEFNPMLGFRGCRLGIIHPEITEMQARAIYERDPFESIDRGGVGALMRIASEKGRARRPKLKLGICGEHGGDPATVRFCHEIGLDYVSCSPFRVPIARLAAARAALGA